ncbi:Rne/Rng family ribonuclease [Pseudoclavibacter sp. RFBA6]|uniref:Rne/Rng family ribonuclease n=1 Tax=Pseudoclavibacter sp. RFBA6 TaxID=2080573 RepID=UPI000CE837CA|nr:Rne/Rng family ribonuclease [Pseudoclavibacter sp. RFBA6]PPG40000.1 ribonuclease E/G [Pseudoclavibacter sp. RFBA6]
MVTTNESDQNTNTESASAQEQLDAELRQESAQAVAEETEEQGSGEDATSPIPAVLSSTTLFFLQPDLPPVLERAPREDRSRSRRQDDEPYERSERADRYDRQESTDRSDRGERSERGDRSDRGDRSRDSSRDDRRQASAERSQSTTRRRQPREEQQAEEPVLITEPQKIKGSTRLEAKRQRRREGRESGRRRQVVTESEFLARRESVDRVMLVRAKDDRVQIGVLEDKVLVEHYVARSQESSLIGNVYLGRVQNVLPSMEAAFIDIGRGRNAVLYSGEVDWAAAEVGGKSRRIENALKPGDRVLVQVTKDPIGHKGARLTSQVSLPGRYLVYVPGNSMNGISRKLPDTERARLKKILKETLPAGVGVIVRTAAEGATQDQLERDVNRLTAQWADISSRIEAGPAPALLHSEPDLLIKIIRDVFNEDFQKIVIQGSDELETITTYLRQVAPDLVDRVEAFQGGDVFAEYRATEHIEKALDRKVWLPSGGSLVIDRTEAMTVVDVNTGKFVGSGGNLEETVTKNNLEAAEEVVRQLRLRDIGGIIVVDFIDMVLESNRDLVMRRLIECLSRDRTKHQVAEVTSLGLVQMTRKKLGLGLLETFSEPCESCAGRGVIVFHDPVLKHRGGAPDSAANSKNGRKGRGGGQQREQQGPRAVAAPAAPSTSTHGITDELRGALSKIAASTINGQKPGEHGEEQAAESQSQPGAQAPAADERGDEQAAQPSESRRSRRGRRRAKTDAQAPASTHDQAHDQAPEVASGDAASVDRNEAQQSDSDDRKARASENLFDFDSAKSAEPAQTTREADPAALRELDSLLDALVAPEGEQQQPAASETTGAPAAVEVTTPAAAPEESQDASVTSAPKAVQPVTAEPPKGASGRPRRRRITTPPLSAE